MSVRHLWMTDCKRLEDHLTAPTMGKTKDTRLSIDLSILRHDIWKRGDEEMEILRPAKLCDNILWFDTSTMAVGCPTKAMPTDILVS